MAGLLKESVCYLRPPRLTFRPVESGIGLTRAGVEGIARRNGLSVPNKPHVGKKPKR